MIDDFAVVFHFVRAARDFVREARTLAAAAGAEHLAAVRRIERAAWALTAVGCVGVPCLAPLAAVVRLGIGPGDAAFRAVLGFFLSLVAAFVYLPGGAALGCALAPDWFLGGPAGRPWRRAFGGWVNSAVFAQFALALVAGMALLFVYMAPTNVW